MSIRFRLSFRSPPGDISIVGYTSPFPSSNPFLSLSGPFYKFITSFCVKGANLIDRSEAVLVLLIHLDIFIFFLIRWKLSNGYDKFLLSFGSGIDSYLDMKEVMRSVIWIVIWFY